VALLTLLRPLPTSSNRASRSAQLTPSSLRWHSGNACSRSMRLRRSARENHLDSQHGTIQKHSPCASVEGETCACSVRRPWQGLPLLFYNWNLPLSDETKGDVLKVALTPSYGLNGAGQASSGYQRPLRQHGSRA